MKELLSETTIKRLAYLLAGFFLAAHVMLFFIFRHYGVIPMAGFNLFSVLFYIAILFLIHKNRLAWFVGLSYLEILLHMGLAVYFTGWNSGFQITLIGICTLLYYAEYVGKTIGIKTIPSLYCVPLAMIVYIGSYIITELHGSPYSFPKEVSFRFQIGWAVVVFAILCLILQIFVTVSTKTQEILTDEVLHDRLTGLPNRYYMVSFFQKLSAADQNKKYWAAIADIDSFKQVNDVYGHNCGDYVLRTFAEILTKEFSHLELCRWGGEEFLIAGTSDIRDPFSELEKIRIAVQKHPFVYEGKKLSVTITIGAAWYEGTMSIDEWIDAADKKLYEGKQAGKNRVVF
ncbi:MAG: GGDEF domain-containing protein [Solobacterium sp.]|nr:GGDEF domain-containing protein [Solobacterium sp.]